MRTIQKEPIVTENKSNETLRCTQKCHVKIAVLLAGETIITLEIMQKINMTLRMTLCFSCSH